ncbi:MAG: hypothetical protein ABIJ45_10940, partial [Candidatus Zixiibacteriota bacterium]
DDALYIFDGGRWETLTAENGLPSDNILTVNADDWLVYIGTDRGTISYFDGDFIPVKNVDKMIANAFARWNNQMIVGTNDAITLNTRPDVKTLVKSDFIDSREPAFVEEILDTVAPNLDKIIGPPPSIVEIDEYQTDRLEINELDTIKKIMALNEEIEVVDTAITEEFDTKIIDTKSEEVIENNQTLTQSGSGL